MKRTIKKTISIVLACVTLFLSFTTMASAARLRTLDLAFVVDTTGSMDDDIAQVKKDMVEYVDDLKETGMDYRIAIVDYRDFPERSYSVDYPYKVQLDFTNNYDEIQNAIDNLSLGHGGDKKETIYSALIDGLDELSWRSNSGKTAILIGDAPALDPEPYTGYTQEDAISKLTTDKIAKDESHMRDSVSAMGFIEAQANVRSQVYLFTVATSSDFSTVNCFNALAEGTGGRSYVASSTVEISEIVEEIIDTIPDIIPEPTFWQKLRNFLLKVWYFITFQWSKI